MSTPRRRRIAYLVPPSAHFAGIERVVHEIATGLVEAFGDRLDVHVVYASRYDEPVLANPAYTMHVLDRNRLRELLGSLRRSMAAIEADVLVCPQVEASVVGWVATQGRRRPALVTHLHGNPDLEERDGTRRTRLAFRVFRSLVRRDLAGALAVSPSLAAHAGRHLTGMRPVHFVPNPLRDLADSDLTAGRPPGPFRFLCVGRLSRQKGQDILVRALASARADLPACTLTLAGTGDAEPALRRLVAELGLEDIVDFAGYRSDPTPLFERADCLVLPSRWEGFGVVLIEALHFGLPVLAADCDFGPADVLDEPVKGRLVAPDDVEALAAGLVAEVARVSTTADRTRRRRSVDPYRRLAAAAAHAAVLHELGVDQV